MRKLLALAIGALALLSLAIAVFGHPAWSQAARTIRIVISVPPGGSIDVLVRILADHLASTKGQSFIVESRPGAGGVIAAEAVARAAPDGNTLLINNNGMIHQLDPAQGELRSAVELRADLLSGHDAVGERSERPARQLF